MTKRFYRMGDPHTRVIAGNSIQESHDVQQDIPVGLEETLPSRLAFPIRRRFDAVCFQDIADRPVRNGMSQISQGALDAVIAPGGILLSHSQHEINDLACDRRASRGFPVLAVVPVSGDELAMPAEDGIWSDDGGKLVEQLAAEDLAFDGEPTSLAIVRSIRFFPSYSLSM